MGEPARYVFDPLDRRGLVAGLRTGQLAVLGVGLVLATAALRAAPDGLGIALAFVVVAPAAAAAFVPVGGQTLEQWAPVVVRRGLRVATRAGAERAASPRRPGRPRLPPMPRAMAHVSIHEVVEPLGPPVAIIRDQRQRTLSAVVGVRGRSFALLDAPDKARRLAAWSSVLAGLAREDGPVRSLQWVERTLPGDGAALGRHLETARVLGPDDPRVTSYRELVAEAGPLGQDHECFVVLSIRDRRRDSQAVLLRELRLLRGQLRTAEIDVVGCLGARALAAAWRTGFDPWARAALDSRAAAHPDLDGVAVSAGLPVAIDESWSALRTDDTWHATFWVAEWPRVEVGPDFLAPLLLHTEVQRSVSVIMGPLPPSAGIREVEAARTAQVADETLRQRAGFLSTARRMREAEGAARREAELSDGHASYRFSGYVTVSARTAEELDEACGQVVQSGHQCRLELRRLHGVQDLAFTWTLPLGRGLAVRR